MTFRDGVTLLATVPLNANGRATYSISALSPGTHSITADYSGDANYFASTSPVLLQGVRSFDPNGDGGVTVADVFYLINTLFAEGPLPVGGGDANGDGSLTVADIFYLINFLFAGGPAPA